MRSRDPTPSSGSTAPPACEGPAALGIVQDLYSAEVNALKAHADGASTALDNAFAFIEGAFGAERELLVFTTELTARKATALFIARFGCAAYDRASEGLMVEEQRSELLAQMEELEL